MKQRESGSADLSARRQLSRVLSQLEKPTDIDAFLDDLCTPAELEALADRWSVVPLLAQGMSYRQIHQETGVSVTTVGRIARALEHGTGGYRMALALQDAHHQT